MNVAFVTFVSLLWTFQSTCAQNFAKETINSPERTTFIDTSVLNVSDRVNASLTSLTPPWKTSLESTSHASLSASSYSTLNNRQRSLFQTQPSPFSNEEDDCQLAPSQQERYYDTQRRTWILTEDDLEEIEDDIQLVVDCASQGHVILFNTARRIEPPRTITITKELTLSAFSRNFNTRDTNIPRTRRRVSITCPSSRESVFDFRHPNVSIGNIVVEDCVLEEGSAIVGTPCGVERTVGRIRLHHMSFENNVNLQNASVMFWRESFCVALHVTDVVLRNNSCGVHGCVQLPREVTLEDIEAISNQMVPGSSVDASIFQGDTVSVNASNLQVSNNSCRAFSVVRSSLRISNSSFVRNSFALTDQERTVEGGVIRTEIGTLILNSCTFLENNATSGGALFAVDCTSSLNRSNFHDNSAAVGGGAVCQEQGTLHIANSTFSNNSAGRGGALAVLDGNVTALESDFTTNRASVGGAFYLFHSGLARFLDSQFVNNTCIGNGGGLYGDNVRLLELVQVLIRDNRASIDGGGVFVIHSNISSDETSFVNNTGLNGGGIAIANTTALIRGTTFSRCSASEGGAIHATDSSNSSILQSYLHMNRANSSGGAVIMVNSQLTGSGAVFTFNRASNGGALFMNQRSRLSFVNSSFIRNQANETGGAISLRTEDTVTIACQIRNSLFRNNSARYGGAMHFERRALRSENCTSLNSVCSGVAILNSSFLNNEAEVAGAAIQVNDVPAVRVACSDHPSRADFITVPQFLELPVVDNRRHCTTWRGNQIGITDHAEGTVGSYASRANVSIATQDTSRQTSNGDLVLEDIRSGDRLPDISLIAVDEFGNGPASPIRGALIANLSSPDEFFPGVILLPLLNGTGVFRDVVGFVRPGTYHLRIDFNNENIEEVDIEVQVRDCRFGEQRTPDSILCQPCDTQSYNFEPNGNRSCIDCPNHSTCTGSFIVPEAGYWHSSPCSSRIQECFYEEACRSTDRRQQLINLSNSFQDCSLSEEELEQYNEQQCSTGYSGALCGACADSYGRYGLFSCAKCLHTAASSIFILLAATWLLFLAGVVTRVSLPSEPNRRSTSQDVEDPESQVRGPSSGSRSHSVVPVNFQMVEMMVTGHVPPEVLAGGDAPSPQASPSPQTEPSDLDPLNLQRRFAIESFKITVNYLQVTAVTATINVVWTDAMSSLLTLADNLGGITIDTVTGSVDCIVSWDSPGLQALIRVLVAILVLIAVCILLAFFWTSYAIHQRQQGVVLGKRMLLSVLVVIYLTYLGLTRMAVKLFFCVDVHDFQDAQMEFSTDRYWAMDTHLKCYEGYHIGLVSIGVLLLIFITLCVPLMSARLAFQCIKAKRNSEEFWVSDTIGFVYKAFEERFVFWESVVMLRKSFLLIVAVFSYRLGGDIQSIMATLILIFALFLHMTCRPYKEQFSILNLYEAVSLFISSVTFIVGICFEQGRSSDLIRILLTIFLFSINIGFAVFMVFVLSRYSTDYIRAVLENEGVPIQQNMKWFTILKLFVLARITRVRHRPSREEQTA